MPDHTARYAVVHLVLAESQTPLIASQVLDHMQLQASSNGTQRPEGVLTVFLEPLRVAVRGTLRRHVAALRRRAPAVRILLHGFVSRLGIRPNARLLAWRIRRRTRGATVVFHCRGEHAVEWARALQPYFTRADLIADIRGAWPEELLFARGFDQLDEADADTRREHAQCASRLHTALRIAKGIISVSGPMLAWLEEEGAPRDRLAYVPCCIHAVTFLEPQRQQMRANLQLGDKTVLVYAGTLAPYQHIEDGVLPFVNAMMARHADVHFLAIVPERERMLSLLHAHDGMDDRSTVVSVPQREVAQYLAAGDAGLLLRAPTRMNRFSQPTKLAEYLAAGLAVVVSRGTGDVDKLIESRNAGFAVDVFGVSPQRLDEEAERVWCGLHQDARGLRRRAIEFCREEFLWSSYIDRVRGLYTASARAIEEVRA